MIANLLSLSLMVLSRGTLRRLRSRSSGREVSASTDLQRDSLVELRVRQLRAGNAALSLMSVRGLAIATSVWRAGKAWPKVSNSAHSDIVLLLMCSLCSDLCEKEGSRVTVEYPLLER
jgi:hypothetical protein